MRNGRLWCDGVAVEAIARRVGTPCYVYSRARLEANFLRYDEAFRDYPHLICYAMKTNSNLAVSRVLSRLGAGADIVSGGELMRAIQAGFPPRKIVFAGVGKTPAEIEAAVRADILMFNVESLPEAEAIGRVAARLGRRARIAFRVNPGVDPGTHRHISTGHAETKFGIAASHVMEAYRRASRVPSLEILGIQAHIGSQITRVAPYVEAVRRLLGWVARLEREGIRIQIVDIGGGLGISYRDEAPPTPADLAKALAPLLPRPRKVILLLEPGRSIAGDAGALLTRVLYLKTADLKNGRGHGKRFVIVDAGMNALIRPTLYDAWHEILPARRRPGPRRPADVVGPICETGDIFARHRLLPPVEAGDCLAVMQAGAYGFVMASNYNSHGRPAEVLVDGARFEVVRARESVRDLLRGERIPAALN